VKYAANPKILDTDDLAQLAWDAIEPIWDDLPYSTHKALVPFMSDLTEGQRGLIALDWCQKEIRNGGLSQLFRNSTGNLVPWAIPGFRLIGADRYADVLEHAASLLGESYPLTASGRKRVFASLSASERATMEKLDDGFFDLLRSEEQDLEHFRGEYVKAHPEQFVIQPGRS
jgi:hypothetical protein